MRISKALAACFVLGLITHSAWADDWFSPTSVSVRAQMFLQRDFSLTSIEFGDGGDMRIEASTSSAGESSTGTMIVISGKYLLVEGLDLAPGAEIDTLDASALQVQMALKLLARAIPDGPKTVDAPQTIKLTEEAEPLEVASPSASGEYPAPWTVTGTIKRETPDRLAFALMFTFAGTPTSVALTGSWESASKAPTLDGSFSVKTWRAFHLGPRQSTSGGSTIADYGAREVVGGFATLAEVRAQAAN